MKDIHLLSKSGKAMSPSLRSYLRSYLRVAAAFALVFTAVLETVGVLSPPVEIGGGIAVGAVIAGVMKAAHLV
jgi:hypothetical protein